MWFVNHRILPDVRSSHIGNDERDSGEEDGGDAEVVEVRASYGETAKGPLSSSDSGCPHSKFVSITSVQFLTTPIEVGAGIRRWIRLDEQRHGHSDQTCADLSHDPWSAGFR
jgi:hypothetical protein